MFCLGLDIGGTKCVACIGRVNGDRVEILAKQETATRATPEETFDALAPAILGYLKMHPVAAGISCGGPLDSERGVLLTPPNLPLWHGFPLADYVRERFQIPAKLENDANACALAEWRFGAGKGTRNMIFFTFGTGLGAGLILDGKLYAGTNGNAGEAGHIRLASRGPMGFGKCGSFEGFCSGGGIARLAAQMAGAREERRTAKQLSEAAFAGEPFARKVYMKSGQMLGRGLAVLIDILNPERIVLGGVFMRSSQLLVPSMMRELKREALKDNLAVCRIVGAQLGEEIGNYAALSVAGGIL